MKQRMRSVTGKVLAMLFALVMVAGMMPAMAMRAEAARYTLRDFTCSPYKNPIRRASDGSFVLYGSTEATCDYEMRDGRPILTIRPSLSAGDRHPIYTDKSCTTVLKSVPKRNTKYYLKFTMTGDQDISLSSLSISECRMNLPGYSCTCISITSGKDYLSVLYEIKKNDFDYLTSYSAYAGFSNGQLNIRNESFHWKNPELQPFAGSVYCEWDKTIYTDSSCRNAFTGVLEYGETYYVKCVIKKDSILGGDVSWNNFSSYNSKLSITKFDSWCCAYKQYNDYIEMVFVFHKQKSTLTEISVLSDPLKTVYTEGEVFDPTGIEIAGIYSGGIKQTLKGKPSYAPSRPLITTDKQITVTYIEDGVIAKTTIPITVNPTSYVSDSYTIKFSPGGGSGTMADISVRKGDRLTLPECTFTPPAGKVFDRWIAGMPGEEVEIVADCTISAFWKGKTDRNLYFITVDKMPDKTTYKEGETFDPAGMYVNAAYSDKSGGRITDYVFSPSGPLKTTDNVVTISYTNGGVTKKAEVPITVTAALSEKPLSKPVEEPASDPSATPGEAPSGTPSGPSGEGYVAVPADGATGSAVSVSSSLKDVDKNAWYAPAVGFVLQKGLMKGISDDQFAPEMPLSRSMIVKILHRLEGEPAATKAASFNDVEAGSWYADAVAWASENNIVSGYSEDSFGPADNINREQFSAIMYRYAMLKNNDTDKSADLSGFEDRSSISSWALPAMQWAHATGLISGRSETTIAPLDEANRAEAAAILMRFIGD